MIKNTNLQSTMYNDYICSISLTSKTIFMPIYGSYVEGRVAAKLSPLLPKVLQNIERFIYSTISDLIDI